MDAHELLLFLGVDLLLVCTPGPDWLYVIARSLRQGKRTGLAAVAGICAGYSVHTAIAAAGLASALRSVPAALPVLRYAGAAYLAVLAVRTLLALRRHAPGEADGSAAVHPGHPPTEPTRVVLRQSMVIALLNPKGLLLYLSLMPQFVSPDAAVPIAVQFAALGCLHVAQCACVYGAVAVTAGRAGTALNGDARASRRMTAVSATLLLLVAAFSLGAQ
ncbi:LysE family translocator [Actinomadura keratinilytica]|jgi:threonine/homoserine/homoserine lactone efflux protein|uniref:LysE family translocator n=1 Tax=Actinomadura keratinilytica TaxID=547461 RepID=A0ABP7YGZ8_9ACTN